MIKNCFIAFLSFSLLGCGIQFQTLTLDDGRVLDQGPRKIVATEVFGNSFADVWGMEKDECKDFSPEDNNTYAGGQSIHLNWNKSTCEWVGFGIGWEAWQPKDLSEVMERGAFRWYMRSESPEASIPTIIFLLEDYAGVMTAAVFGAENISRYPFDDSWQLCQLPLSEFTPEKDGIDLTNIKQLVLEFQGAGSVYMDEMTLEEFKPFESEKEAFGPSTVAVDKLPQVVFDEKFRNVWGLMPFSCRDFKVSDGAAHSGSKYVEMSWQTPADDECRWNSWGTNWKSWLAMDFGPVLNEGQIEFYIQNQGEKAADLPVKVGFETYDGQNSMIALESSRVEGGVYDNQWRKVAIPINEFDWAGGLRADNIKQLLFSVEESGHIYLDDIRIVKKQ